MKDHRRRIVAASVFAEALWESSDHLYSPEWQITHKKEEKYSNNRNDLN